MAVHTQWLRLPGMISFTRYIKTFHFHFCNIPASENQIIKILVYTPYINGGTPQNLMIWFEEAEALFQYSMSWRELSKQSYKVIAMIFLFRRFLFSKKRWRFRQVRGALGLGEPATSGVRRPSTTLNPQWRILVKRTNLSTIWSPVMFSSWLEISGSSPQTKLRIFLWIYPGRDPISVSRQTRRSATSCSLKLFPTSTWCSPPTQSSSPSY